MKNILYILFSLILVFVFTGCDEDPELTRLRAISFDGNITASTDNLTLTEEDSLAEVITFNWPAVDYFIEAPVTYSLEFTTPDDTTDWANSYIKEIGDDVLTATLTGKEVNMIAKDQLGLESEVAGTMAVRVRSFVDRAAYTGAIAIDVTPYEVFVSYPSLWVAGDFQGWNVSTAPTLVSKNEDDVYEGYIYIPAGGTLEFKLYAQPDWAPTSYGDGGDGVLIEANYAGGNFSVPSEGYYLFTVDLNTMTYLLIKTEWGLIGAAAPNGWDSSTPMTYDPGNQVWTVTADMIADGSFKIRANNAWQLDFGLDEEGNLAYANHPWLPYVERPHLTVPEDGNYTITMDLHDPANYTYSIVKN